MDYLHNDKTDYIEELMAAGEITREEKERKQRQKEEIARMKREKNRQLKRRRRMKRLLKKGGGVAAAFLIAALAFTAVRNKTEDRTVSAENGLSEEDVREEKSSMEADEVQSAAEGEEEAAGKITETVSFRTTAETASMYDEIISTNAILIDESADTVVASKGAKERISPASMTKVLTVLVAAEHLKEEQLKDTFTMTREITDYGYVNDCSSVGFLEGEEIPVTDLFYGTILPSGSDAAVGLAVYVAGSQEEFVKLMNQKVQQLGLEGSTHMTNCVGLYDKEHYTTVYDMAVIMKAALENELCRKVLSEHNYTTTPTPEHPEGINISNWFLRRIEDKDTGGEVLCAKTGYVSQSKSCAVSYGSFGEGKNYICVTAGSSSSWRCIYDHVDIYTSYIS